MRFHLRSWRLWLAGTMVLGAATTTTALIVPGGGASASIEHADSIVSLTAKAKTTTPIKHVVVIFDENISFDHYFGTYPKAANTDGEPFYAAPGTPSVNGLSNALLTANPNGINPARLSYTPNGILTCDENHGYTQEQFAMDNGAMDRFTVAGGTATTTGQSPTHQPCTAGDVMNYYDGNVATGLWNYAQHFAMNDNSFGTTFGPSAPGAVNLVSGQTGGVDTAHSVRNALTDGDTVSDGTGGQTLISDAQPYWDDCSSRDAVALTGRNIGDQLNEKNLSWGFFQGGFTPNSAHSGPADTASTYNQLNEPGRATCTTTHNVGAAIGGTGSSGQNAWGTKADYIQHHEPFQYYASTANPHHLAPSSLGVVGTDTATDGEFNTANHQYDSSTFDSLVSGIDHGTLSPDHFPALSILKAPGYQDGHAAYSDPVDEQVWLVNEINAIESLPTWKSTAIFIAYDDSDGFYDHAFPGNENPSLTSADALTSPGKCGTESATNQPLFNEQGRCGYAQRQPLVLISPYARQNFVSTTLTDQSSIMAFVEQNWSLGQIPGSFANVAGTVDDMFDFSAHGSQLADPLFLSPTTGEPSTPIVGKISPNTGPVSGGTTVTISGLNFSTAPGGTTVRFGNRDAASVNCAASATMKAPATVCTVVTPPANHTGPVTVTVRVGSQTAENDAGDFTYTP